MTPNPGITADGRLWWQLTSAYWDLPFYSDCGMTPLPDRDDWLAAREQLWAIRESLFAGNEDLQPI